MDQKPIDLSIVVPLYNEERVFDKLLPRLLESAENTGASYEIILVNDGSRDDTLSKMLDAARGNDHIQFISFSRNFGHQVAISAGMEFSSGEAIITIDGDLQDPPELFGEMYNEYLKGSKVVYAQRIRRKGDPVLKKTATYFFYRLLARIVPFKIPLDVGDYRLISREVLTYLRQMNEYDKYLRGQIAWLGFNSAYVTYVRDERKFGKSNYPFWKLFRLAFNGITSFSDTPLRLATKLGFTVCFASLILAGYALYSFFIKQVSPPGWASLMITITFLGGAQLLSLGFIGEYISRIINNVRKRPLYVVDKMSLFRAVKTAEHMDES
jgi:glycosyltransferase involved in cell wall biosynthesis